MNENVLIEYEMNKRKEIVENFDKNYFLEAGAGAGKTTIIVDRIINHIKTGKINPSELVAITFTKASSTELAERIQSKALKCIKEGNNPQVIERLKSVDKIFTGTIHSFCELMLKEMPFDAEIPLNYEIIEDEDDLHENIWNSFLREKQEEYKETIDLLKTFNVDYRKLKKSTILALKNPDVEFNGYGDINYSFDELVQLFEGVKKKCKLLSEEYLKNNSSFAKLFRSILTEKKEFSYYFKGLSEEFYKTDYKMEDLFEKLVLKKFQGYENSKDYINLIEEIKEIYSKSNNTIYNLSVKFINMAVDYKNENYQNRLTFNDLLYKASKLIKDSSVARAHYKNKYKYFYVDEFQDTDPMQVELILQLTDSKSELGVIKHWEDCKPSPGSLFIVGDPKQSIYRFRRADITIYNKVKKIIEDNGEVVFLDINFRSSDEICSWVEDTFKNKEGFGFREEATDIQAGFKRILSIFDLSSEISEKELEKETLLKGVYKYNYPEKEDQEYVANLVNDILKNQFIIKKNLKEDKTKNHYAIEKVKAGDIMILTKGNKETGSYLSALKSKEIPALLAGEKSLSDNREVLNLFLLIDSLIDYRDNIKIVSVLRNSFYIDLDTIDLFMEKNKVLSKFIFFRKEISKINHPSIKVAFTNIAEIMELSQKVNPLSFIERIVFNKIGVYDLSKEYSKFELRDAESGLRQTIEILKSKKCGSLYNLREEFKRLITNKVKYELPVNREESKNAVRIMNLHKAKGLESEIVLLVGGQKKRKSPNNNPTHFVEKDSERNNQGYIFLPKDLNVLCPNETAIKEQERNFIESEIDRLIYVAATRGKSTLIVANSIEDKQFLFPLAINIENEIKSDGLILNGLEQKVMTKEKEKELKVTKDLRLLDEISSPSYLKLTPSEFNVVKERGLEIASFKNDNIKLKRSSLVKYKTLQRKLSDLSTESYNGPRGKVYGTIIHRAFEVLINNSKGLANLENHIIDFATKIAVDESLEKLELNNENISLLYSTNIKRINEILNIKIEKGNIHAINEVKLRLYSYIRATLGNFVANDDIVEIFQNAEKVYTELPFTIGINKENQDILQQLSGIIPKLLITENKPILINGVIDLVVKSKDGTWVILDYKSDICFRGSIESSLRGAYTSQLEGYKVLFEDIMKDDSIEVGELLFYSTFADKVISVYEKVLV